MTDQAAVVTMLAVKLARRMTMDSAALHAGEGHYAYEPTTPEECLPTVLMYLRAATEVAPTRALVLLDIAFESSVLEPPRLGVERPPVIYQDALDLMEETDRLYGKAIREIQTLVPPLPIARSGQASVSPRR